MTERAIIRAVALADLIICGAVRWMAIIAAAALVAAIITGKRRV